MKKVRFLILFLTILIMIGFMITNVSAKTVKKSGWYTTSLVKGSFEEAIGKVKFKSNKMITYGGFRYSKNHSYEGSKVLKPKKRVFIIDKKVKFYGTNASEKVVYTRMTNKDGKALIKKCNGLGLDFKIKKGKIVRFEFWS